MRSTRTDSHRVPGWALACLLLGLVACASVPRHVPVPPELADAAEIAWMPQARFWGDETPAWVDGMLASSPRELREAVPALFGKPHTYLAVSGEPPQLSGTADRWRLGRHFSRGLARDIRGRRSR